MKKEPPVHLSQEMLAELFEEIRDKLDILEEKLDYLIDNQPSTHPSTNSFDSNLDDY